MKRIFKPVSQNELAVSAAGVLASAVLYLIAMFIKVGNTDVLQVTMYAFSIAAACYKTALSAIENLLDKKPDLRILNVIAVLALFLGGGKASAAITAIFFGFADLASTYFEINASEKFLARKCKIKYTAVTEKGDVTVNASRLKQGSVVKIQKGDFLCFDCQNGDEKIPSGYYDGEPATVMVAKVYNIGVDFKGAAKAYNIGGAAVKFANAVSLILPVLMFVLGLVYAFVYPEFAGRYVTNFATKIGFGAPIMILGLAKVAVSGVYIAAVLGGNGSAAVPSDVKAVVINKNKALCRGEFTVADVAAANGIEKEKIVELCLAVQPDENAYAKAFAAYLNQNVQKIPARFTKGEGFEAELDESSIAIGSKVLMDRLGIDVSGLPQYNVFVAVNGSAVGAVRLSDRLKANSVQAVKTLKKQGKAVYIITADGEMTAKAVAENCGADGYFALCSSENKAEKIGEIREQFGKVAYIGDDENALGAADVSVEYVDDSVFDGMVNDAQKSDVNKLSVIRIIAGLVVIAVLLALCITRIFKTSNIYIPVLIQFAMCALPEYLLYRSVSDSSEKKPTNNIDVKK